MIELLIKGVLNFKNCRNKLIVIIRCIISDEKEPKSFIIDFKPAYQKKQKNEKAFKSGLNEILKRKHKLEKKKICINKY